MKIFDCFMYNNEDIVLEVRLNTLAKYVHKFVIVESCYDHQGKKKKLNFSLKKFKKFKEKINYIVLKKFPRGLTNWERENYNRNYLNEGIKEANANDYIMISDLDEIPNIKNYEIFQKKKFTVFKQMLFYYRFNLLNTSKVNWYGTKACKKKYLKSAQWLRNIKDRNYPWWRIDTMFSDTKYSDIEIINDGGWHFSYIKSPENIEKKLKSYLHHTEYELNPVGSEKISELIKQKKTVYNLKVDSRSNKFNDGNSLEKLDINSLPKYIRDNLIKFNDWIIK